MASQIHAQFHEALEQSGMSPELLGPFAVAATRLATCHRALCSLALDPGLDSAQEAERNMIEERFRALVTAVAPAVTEVRFMYDPRGATVRVMLASGAHNSLADGWGVPVHERMLPWLVKAGSGWGYGEHDVKVAIDQATKAAAVRSPGM